MSENTALFTKEGKKHKGEFEVDGKKRWVTTKQDCPKCGGRGYGPWFQDGGICYKCDGTGDGGWKTERLYTAEELAKLNDKEEAKRIANAQKKAQELTERLGLIRAEHGFLIDEADELRGEDEFIADVLSRIYEYGKVSEKQIEALASVVEKVKEKIAKKATKGEAPTGRVRVVAKVLGKKLVASMYGSQVKMLIELDNGATAWGTAPNKLYEQVDNQPIVGVKFEFEADFERTSDDATHAFFKRPTKVKVIGA